MYLSWTDDLATISNGRFHGKSEAWKTAKIWKIQRTWKIVPFVKVISRNLSNSVIVTLVPEKDRGSKTQHMGARISKQKIYQSGDP